MNKLSQYTQLVEKSYQISSPLLLDTALQQVTTEKDSIITSLQSSGSIKVPIVGDFNAGKSSLLNAFVGKEILPVEITPETAVAYELYYDINERVELFRENIKIASCDLNGIKQLSTRPGDIAKVYLNSTKIKDLELRGITLVDMPGIDSGIQEHNDAILNYINKGTVFILLVDCAGGTLRQSTLAFLAELAKYNLKPAIFLSKIDKKPASQLTDVYDYISFQARKVLGGEVYVGKLSSHTHEIGDFETFLNQIDVNQLITEKYANRLTLYFNQQINALNAQINIYSTDIENADKQLQALEQEKLQATTTIKNAHVGDTPQKSTQDVLDLVAASLKSHSGDIAQMVIEKASTSEINARILNYIRPVIVLAFKEEGEQYASAMNTVVDNVSTALQNNLSIDGNLFDNLVDSFRGDIVGGISIAADILIAMPNVFAKALGWVLQFLGDKVPDLLKWFLGKSKDDVLVEVTGKVESSIIPQIIERLRPEILQQITAQQERIRENISSSVASTFGNLQDSVMSSKEVSDKAILNAKISDLKSAIDSISTLKTQI